MTQDQNTALPRLRVIELGGAAAACCGHVLADLGADVVKVEPPEGDSYRWEPPFAGNTPDPEKSLWFLNFNTNKRSIVLDLTKPEGQETLRALARTADVLIESHPVGYLQGLGLDFPRLRRVNPGLVYISITPFGQTGPFSGYKGNNAVAEAMSGIMFVGGDLDRAPCVSPYDQLYQVAGLHGTAYALMALRHRKVSGRGQHIDISLQELGTQMQVGLSQFAHAFTISRRVGTGPFGGGTNIHKIQDGYLFLMPGLPHQWFAMVRDWMQDPVLSQPEWENIQYRQQNKDVIETILHEFVINFTLEEFLTLSQNKHRIPSGPVNTPGQFAESPQLKVREWWVERTHPRIGRYRGPGYPFRMAESPMGFRRPAPLLGEHQREVLEELARRPRPAPLPRSQGKRRRLPLEGIRVADFTRVIAGPMGTQMLGFFGAEVIKIESAELQGGFRDNTSPGFSELNRAKKSITLDVRTPEGRELVKKLVSECDVAVENFSAHVMDRLGLGYEELRKVNPDLIMVSMPGAGKTGPMNDWVTWGQILQANTGLMYLWGYPDAPVEGRPKYAYGDYVGGVQEVVAILAALEYRDRTGKGQFIEQAQIEGLASVLGPAYLDYFINGHDPEAQGYASTRYAPYGDYRCRGDDAWCVIACETDGEWKALGEAIGAPGWAADERFATKEGRIANKEALDLFLESWTKDFTPQQVMHILQKAGVAAGAIQSAQELYYDHHLRERGHIVKVPRSAGDGSFIMNGVTGILSETPGDATFRAPLMGEHNDYVFGQLLGLPPEEISRLQEAKVIR